MKKIALIIFLTILTLLATLTSVAPAFGASTADDSKRANIEVKSGIRLGKNEYVLQLEYKPKGKGFLANPDFLSSNLSIYCVKDACYQQSEAESQRDVDKGKERVAFFTENGAVTFNVGIDFKRNFAGVFCTGRPVRQATILNLDALMSVQRRIQTGEWVIHSIPDARKIETYFKITVDQDRYHDQAGKHVFVDSSKFREPFGNYRVFIGEPGKMEPTNITRKEWIAPRRYESSGSTEVCFERCLEHDGERCTNPRSESLRRPHGYGYCLKLPADARPTTATFGSLRIGVYPLPLPSKEEVMNLGIPGYSKEEKLVSGCR